MDEFAMGTSTETSYFGPTRNPWDLDRVPLVVLPAGPPPPSAAGEARAALGSDTGGSIRKSCLLLRDRRLKADLWSRLTVRPRLLRQQPEQIGPLALTVEDAALVLDVIAGHDPRDSTSANPLGDISRPWTRGGWANLGGPEEYFGEGVNPKVEVGMGCHLKAGRAKSWKEVSLPHTKYALSRLLHHRHE